MIKKLFVAVLVLSSLAACKSKTAFNYSQDIVAKEKSLMTDIESTENKVKAFLENEQYDSIAAAGARMEKLVDARLTEIKDKPAPDVKEGESFKDASLKYFRFIKSLYTGYKDFGNASSTDAREKEMSKLREMVLHKTEAVTDMQKAQRKFAEANGFKLEDK